MWQRFKFVYGSRRLHVCCEFECILNENKISFKVRAHYYLSYETTPLLIRILKGQLDDKKCFHDF